MRIASRDFVGCLSSQFLQLILLPTERCNFRCTYCWEEFTGDRMQPWAVEALKTLIARRADNLQHLALEWFGGEPLLAVDIVEEIQRAAQTLQKSRPGLTVDSSITTNAYLLDRRMLDRLLEVGVNTFRVAVDGVRSTHDARRVTAGGKGSFDRVWANLLAVRDRDGELRVCVRWQIGDESPRRVMDFLELYAVELAEDDRFELAIVPLSCFRSSDKASRYPERASLLAAAARAAAKEMGIRNPPSGEGPHICHAARANVFMVRPNGALAKCPVALYKPENQVGQLKKDGTVKIDAEKMAGWMRGLQSGNEDDLRCPMQGFADGAIA